MKFCLMICKKRSWSCIKNTQTPRQKRLIWQHFNFCYVHGVGKPVFIYFMTCIHHTQRSWERGGELKVKGEGGNVGLVVEEDEWNVSQGTPYCIFVSYYSVQQFFRKTYDSLRTLMNIVPMHSFSLRKK